MLAKLGHKRFDWKLTLLVLVLCPVLVSLGFWQLQREQEKIDLLNLYTERQQQAPVDIALLDPLDDLSYRQVTIAGSFDNTHVFLLDNKTYQGQPGYEVIVPLHTTAGTVAFINRGWIPQGQYRDQLPAIASVFGEVSLTGSVYVAVGKQLVLGTELAAQGWPKVIQTLEPAALFTLAGKDARLTLFPFSIRLAQTSPHVFMRNWPAITTSPEKHRGYAVQWFAMAVTLLGLFLYYSLRSTQK